MSTTSPEIINVRVYDSSGVIDSTLIPTLSIYDGNMEVISNATMAWNSIVSHYQYTFTGRDVAKSYLVNFDFGAGAQTRYASMQIDKGTSINPSDIWNAPIEDNSSVVGSFGNKISQYGGVSHVVREIESKGGSLTDEDKKFIKDIKEILERIEKKDVGERIIEVTKVERIAVPSVDNSLITDVVIEGLADIREELLDTMVESLSEIKNKK